MQCNILYLNIKQYSIQVASSSERMLDLRQQRNGQKRPKHGDEIRRPQQLQL